MWLVATALDSTDIVYFPLLQKVLLFHGTLGRGRRRKRNRQGGWVVYADSDYQTFKMIEPSALDCGF